MSPHEMTPDELYTLLWAIVAGVCLILLAVIAIPKDAGRHDDDDPPMIFPPF